MLYLPDFPCDWVLSRWTGRPSGLSIDPLGVECFVPVDEPRRGLFGRRRSSGPVVAPYLHVLVHTELSTARILSWAQTQVAQLGVLDAHPEASGDALNRLTDEQVRLQCELAWQAATVVIDGAAHEASAFVAEPRRWAAFVDLGADRVVLVGRDLSLDDARLRTASSDEARRLRTDALKV